MAEEITTKEALAEVGAWLNSEKEELKVPVIAVASYLKKTLNVAAVGTGMIFLTIIFYCIVMYLNYNPAVRGPRFPNLYYSVWFLALVVSLIGILINFIATARLGYVTGLVWIGESLALWAAQVIVGISALIPDFVENFLDREKRLEKFLNEAKEKHQLKEAAQGVLFGFMGALAWVYLSLLVILMLPFSVFSSAGGILIVIIALVFEIYAIYGWSRAPFWLNVIQQFGVWLGAGLILWHVVALPLVESTAAFESFGADGDVKKLFWYIIILSAVAITAIGVRMRTDDKGFNQFDTIAASNLGIAAALVITALLFGHWIIAIIPNTPEVKMYMTMGVGIFIVLLILVGILMGRSAIK